jgi:anti-anti-sigma regulatory factor
MGRFSRGGISPQVSVRSDDWGPVIVALRGQLNWESVEPLNRCLREHQNERDVVLDVWDVTRCEDAALIAVLQAARTRAEDNGRGFALVADPSRTCMHTIEENPGTRSLLHCRDTQAACVALRRVAA